MMKPMANVLIAALVAIGLAIDGNGAIAAPVKDPAVIVSPKNASPLETLAAREVRRYVYLRTGRLLPTREAGSGLPAGVDVIVIARKDRPFIESFAAGDKRPHSDLDLDSEHYLLRTFNRGENRAVFIAGGGDVGTLYGAYRFAEHLGVRFYLHGDVIPDTRIDFEIPDLIEAGKPLFEYRGIQPFHDFPEGPDWWNLHEYKAVLSQLPKLRMNFFGLHTYPEGRPNAEPTVWIGLPGDVGENGKVEFSYPASYQNTMRGNWGYAAKKTSDFIHGGANLFDSDAFGPDCMLGHLPRPNAPEDCNAVFDATAELLREAFEHAHALGIKTCVGTETPLTIPKRVQERLKEMGKNPADPAVVQELYEGVFRRAAQTYPLDFYWFWTPEGWTWQGVKSDRVQKTIGDMKLAIAAAKKANAPFTLATCGWVLGPQGDRAMWDRTLPEDMPLSCINRKVGKEFVDAGFANVKRKNKWAIPWMEDDPALTSAQLWVGRMRKDAVDALRYGCNGLMGIHWRTRVLGPNVLALAHAAWDQREFLGVETPRPIAVPGEWGQLTPVGGNVAKFPSNPIADTDDDPLYQTVRYDVSAYRLKMDNRKCTVTLKFCEPHYTEKGKRIFGVKIEGKTVVERLDIFEKVGQNKAVDFTFDDINVRDGQLDIDFVKQTEFPSIAAIVVESEGASRKVNCGGDPYADFEADPPLPPRHLPAGDFYLDWARHQFGGPATGKIARIFNTLDGKTPRSSEWVKGPGGLPPDPRPWSEAQKDYAFLEELRELRGQISGAGNLDRFDYWLGTFQYMRSASYLRCLWAEYLTEEKKLKAEKDTAAKQRIARESLLPIRIRMVKALESVHFHLLPTVSNTGELGTVANWNQHIQNQLFEVPGKTLAAALGEPLPDEAIPRGEYKGPARLFVVTTRGTVEAGEALNLRVICLDRRPPREVTLFWREMGEGEFSKAPVQNVARGVYQCTIPDAATNGLAVEYYMNATTASGASLHFPPTAPELNQTAVVMPRVK